MIVAVADTHTIIWYIYGDSRLSKAAKNFIENAADNRNQVGFSAITLVEIVYLIEKGRIAVETLTRLLNALDSSTSVLVEIPLDRYVARTVTSVSASEVPDLPDRIIAATALHLGIPLLSRDRQIRVSAVETIW